jgi:hypothetical protein
MSEERLSPLPPDLTALLALERDAHGDLAALEGDVLRHVETAVALSGAATAAAGAGLGASSAAAGAVAAGGAKKLALVALVAFMAGGGVGAGVTAALHERRAVPVTPAPIASNTAAELPPPPVLAASSLPSEAPAPQPSNAAATSAHAASSSGGAPASSNGDLVRERELLDVARAALARGRPADAVAAAEEHARRWPRGHLAEEREVVFVQGLVAAGRRREAETKATQFRERFPASMLTPAVDLALDERKP